MTPVHRPVQNSPPTSLPLVRSRCWSTYRAPAGYYSRQVLLTGVAVPAALPPATRPDLSHSPPTFTSTYHCHCYYYYYYFYYYTSPPPPASRPPPFSHTPPSPPSRTTAKLASRARPSPPSLYASPLVRDREATDSPVATPPPPPPPPLGSKDRPLFRRHGFDCPDDLFASGAAADELLFLGHDDFDHHHHHSDDRSPHAALPAAATMATSASSPIDINTPRNSPPVPQTSNLTSQLQAATDMHRKSNFADHRRPSDFAPDAYGMSNSRPIAVTGGGGGGGVVGGGAAAAAARGVAGAGAAGQGEDRQRRGSNQPGSVMGMSWGGMSIGSFIRDDIMMGTSPFTFQSPSFHSSSYLPKMEANFMRDYVCCGTTLDSMHELLQHYEEAHAGIPNQTMGRTPRDQQAYNEARPQDGPAAAAAAAAAAASVARQQGPNGQAVQGMVHPAGLGLTSPLSATQDMDDLDAMEMDDPAPAPAVQPPQPHQYQPQPHFGRQQPRAPVINTGLAGAYQSAQISTPTTPQPAHTFAFSHNPTVSSVNTPTFGSHMVDSGGPTSPSDFGSGVGTPRASQADGFDYAGLNGLGPDCFTTIDEPAKRLLSKQGFGNINNMQNQSDIAKRIRESQLSAGMDPAAFNFGTDEIKPFRCPVIGCEKAYKNQNGLKYHKQHGHQNQQLKENHDGTFSIVDPATSIPYPGTVGMEKEKPYRCEVCGKRYKNLNGLKYHRQHSPPCNPDLKINPALNVTANLGLNVNVAGAGLVSDGIGI